MRLTLRTLLAYLDDILEPSQAKEIGEKLHESSFASSLVSRIREVMRRRRLAAPALSGPGVGIDPNTLGEYLDNTLAPDGVADVEKICLESDVHLAEVAACHQILALALGEPVEIPQRMRERMYGLGPSASRLAMRHDAGAPGASSPELGSEAVAQVLAQAEPAHQGNGQPPAAPAADTTRAFREGLPDYLKPKPATSRIMLYLLATAGILGWAYVTFMNSPFRPKEPSRAAGLAKANLPDVQLGPAQGEIDDSGAVAAPGEPDQHPASSEPADGSTAATSPEAASTGLAEVNGLPVDETGEKPEPYRKPAEREDAAEASSAPGEPAPTDERAVQPPPVAAPTVTYASKEGAVLYFDSTDQTWYRMQSRAQVRGGDKLAVPDPFDAHFDVDGGRLLVTLLARGTALWLPPGEAGGFGLDLRRGQALFRAASTANESEAVIRMGVVLAGQLWQLELAPGAVCRVAAVPPEPAKFEQTPPESAWLAAIYVEAGSVIATRLGPQPQAQKLEAAEGLQLPLPLPRPDDSESPLRPGSPMRQMPKWLAMEKASPPARNLAAAVDRELRYKQPVILTLPAVAKDSNPSLAEWATTSLGLIDATDALVEILRNARHEEARNAAITALRLWLPREPQNRDLLLAALGKQYPPAEADLVYKLLWGVDEEDARTKEYSRDLIELMHAGEPSIRALAFLHAKRLTRKDYGYRPNGTEAQRASAIKQWRGHLDRNEGALLPAARPRAANP